jgi:hypothetical protein
MFQITLCCICSMMMVRYSYSECLLSICNSNAYSDAITAVFVYVLDIVTRCVVSPLSRSYIWVSSLSEAWLLTEQFFQKGKQFVCIGSKINSLGAKVQGFLVTENKINHCKPFLIKNLHCL